MATKLTIYIDDTDNENDPIASAVSNLEYDGFDILSWDIGFNVEVSN